VPGRYEHFYRQLAAALAGERAVPVTAESATQVIRVLEAALRSSAEQRSIALA
jgi:scyllo-inositol 2-dehydrogenase (NADP+)